MKHKTIFTLLSLFIFTYNINAQQKSTWEEIQDEFQPLTKPEHGMQLHLGPFDIQPNFEREFFYYLPLNNNEEIFINRVEINMRRGSHHFIAYQLKTQQSMRLVEQLKACNLYEAKRP